MAWASGTGLWKIPYQRDWIVSCHTNALADATAKCETLTLADAGQALTHRVKWVKRQVKVRNASCQLSWLRWSHYMTSQFRNHSGYGCVIVVSYNHFVPLCRSENRCPVDLSFHLIRTGELFPTLQCTRDVFRHINISTSGILFLMHDLVLIHTATHSIVVNQI